MRGTGSFIGRLPSRANGARADRARGLALVVVRRFVRTDADIVQEARERREQHAGNAQRLRDALPYLDERADLRIGRQIVIKLRPVAMMQHVHHVRAADAFGIVDASVLEAARLQVLDPLLRVSQHVLLRAENERAGRARFDARGLASGRDAIGAERAFVRLAVDAREPRDVERAAGDAVAAADAVLAVEVDDAVRVLHDRAGRRARGEAARLRAMHAAVLADQPLEIAALVLVLGET